MPVILNRYRGDHFEKPDCRCDQCGQVGTVYMFRRYHNVLPTMDVIEICQTCLDKAVAEMQEAILEDATR